MTERKRNIRVNGYDIDTSGRLTPSEIDFEYPPYKGPLNGYGSYITKRAAHRMVEENYWKNDLIAKFKKASSHEEKELIMDRTVSISFNKNILMLILSQAGCAGIRFYLCRTPEGKQSLVLAGIGEDGKDLSSDQGSVILDKGSNEKTLLAEVGGHESLRHFIGDDKEIGNAFNESLSAYFESLL